MGLGCGGYVAKYLLCLFNFGLFAAGGAVITAGVWLNLDKKSFIGFIRYLAAQVHVDIPREFQNMTHPEGITQVTYVLIGLGLAVFVVSFMGYCGAVRESRICLSMYGILLVLILVLEITVAGMSIAYRTRAEHEIRKILKDTIKEYYTPPQKDTEAVTFIWDRIMAEMHCCGVDSYEDFSEKFKKGVNITKEIPAACCVLEGDTKKLVPKYPNCTQAPSSANSYYEIGCYNTIVNKVLDRITNVIWVILGVIFVELFVVFLSFCLCRAIYPGYDDDK